MKTNSDPIKLIAALILASQPVWAHDIDLSAPKANELFGKMEAASNQEASPIGRYAKGCLAGGVQLSESGTTWQAMRLSRNRHWGHPVLVDYIVDLSERVVDFGWKGLYVGDMAQPRGGPMTSGHQSHQIGLDVDIWMLPPDRLDLTEREREEISSISVRTEDQSEVNENWTDSHMRVLRAAATDPRVDRIFVSAAVKVAMCAAAGDDSMWLQKIRPYYGHNYHFHVRLKCPDNAPSCVTQTPTVAELSNGGNGCDKSLMWWVTKYLDILRNPPPPPKDPPPKKRGAREYVVAELPEQCQSVLESQ